MSRPHLLSTFVGVVVAGWTIPSLALCLDATAAPKRPGAAFARCSGRAELPRNGTAAMRSHPRIPFVANHGQVNERVRFYAQTFGGTVFVMEGGAIVYALPGSRQASNAKGIALRETLVGRREAVMQGESRAAPRVSHFKGQDPARWRSGIPAYDRVSLGEVYDGIECKLRSHGNNVEKLFFVAPGASPNDIRVRLSGALGLRVNGAGELEVTTQLGVVTFTKPTAFQNVSGKSKHVEAAYAVHGDEYGFEVGPYDRARTLIIDPLLASTYVGGSGGDGLYECPIARDATGNIYIAGRTNSDDLPTSLGAYQDERAGGKDVYIAKLSGDLSTLLAATYLGGTGHDGGWPGVGLTLDTDGNVYVTGKTASTDFPFTSGAYDEDHSGEADVFIAKFDDTLSNLLASTFFGGTAGDEAHCIVADGNECIYVVGQTASGTGDFPITPGAYQDEHVSGGHFGYDVFVARFDTDLQELLASTFLGGGGDEFPEVIRLGANHELYLTGWTASLNFPTSPTACWPSYNGGMYDAFVSKLSADLTALPGSTYLGGTNWDFGYALTLDAQGNVYVSGHTASGSPAGAFPTTPGAYDETYNSDDGAGIGDDVFVSKLDGALETLLASTFLGGSAWENGTALCVDNLDYVYIAGSTNSEDFPTTAGAYDRVYDGGTNRSVADGYIARFDPTLSTLSAATYFGGSGDDCLASTLWDPQGYLWLGGGTGSEDFPIGPGAYDGDFNGGSSIHDWRNWGGDLFIAQLDRLLSKCPGDLNGDGSINLADLAQLLGHYSVSAGAAYADGDLDGDGDVDLSDLAALLGSYGGSCE